MFQEPYLKEAGPSFSTFSVHKTLTKLLQILFCVITEFYYKKKNCFLMDKPTKLRPFISMLRFTWYSEQAGKIFLQRYD